MLRHTQIEQLRRYPVPAVSLIRSRTSLAVQQVVFFMVLHIPFMTLLETNGGLPDRGLVRSPGRPYFRYRPYHLTPQDLAMQGRSAAPVRVIPSRSTSMASIIRLTTSASFSVLYALAGSSTVGFSLFMDGVGRRDQWTFRLGSGSRTHLPEYMSFDFLFSFHLLFPWLAGSKTAVTYEGSKPIEAAAW